ncbi:MAG: molybdenum ABC transporter ATP-binding protein [Acidobacteriota bacterium]
MSRFEIDLVWRGGDEFALRVEIAADGPTLGVVGPSGAGKTSLLEVVAGLRRGASGTLRVDGETWIDAARRIELPAEARGVGWVPQEGLLFPHWSVRRNLLAGARRARRAGRDLPGDLAQVVELLEIGHLLRRSPRSLSGGERQRVALGRALCSAPRLLVLDEPFAALDLARRRRLLSFLLRARRRLKVPMLFVSHDPVEIETACDEIVVLDGGQVRALGPARQILRTLQRPGGGVETVFDARVVARDLVQLEPGGPELHVVGAPAAGAVVVGIRADDVLLATERPIGLSARNVHSARIESISPHGMVELRLEGAASPLVAEVTSRAVAELGLEVGSEVLAIVKASALRLEPDVEASG